MATVFGITRDSGEVGESVCLATTQKLSVVQAGRFRPDVKFRILQLPMQG